MSNEWLDSKVVLNCCNSFEINAKSMHSKNDSEGTSIKHLLILHLNIKSKKL